MESKAHTSEDMGKSQKDNIPSEPLAPSECSNMVHGQGSTNHSSQNCQKNDSEIKTFFHTSHSSSDLSNRASSLSPDYDSTSLNPKVTFQRALNSMYSRWVKVNVCQYVYIGYVVSTSFLINILTS